MTKYQRKSKKKLPDAILAADWHLRPDTPMCRTDDFFAAMEFLSYMAMGLPKPGASARRMFLGITVL